MTNGMPPAAPPPAERDATRTVIYIPQPPRRSVVGTVFRYIGVVVILGSFLLNLLLFDLLSLKPREDGLNERRVSGPADADQKVAVISVAGTIAGSRDGLLDEGNLSYVLRQLKRAREDEKVVGVVLEVDSPGGTITASDEIMNAVQQVKKTGKKVVAWMGGLATSGGYYVSCKADSIIAAPTTITGSIGVVAVLGNLEGLAEKIGVRVVVFKSGPYKDIGSPFREMTDVEKEKMQGLINDAFGRFKQVVSDGRGLTIQQVDKLADGSVFTAQEAWDLKLIDRIGYLDDAVEEAQGTHKDCMVVRYSQTTGLLGVLIGRTTVPRDVHVHLDTPLSKLTPGLHYLWLPGASFKD